MRKTEVVFPQVFGKRRRMKGLVSDFEEISREMDFERFGSKATAYRQMVKLKIEGLTNKDIGRQVGYTAEGVRLALSRINQFHNFKPMVKRHRRTFKPKMIVRRIEAELAEDRARRTLFFETFKFESKLDRQILKLKRQKLSLRKIEARLRGPNKISFIAIRDRLEKIERQYSQWVRELDESKVKTA